MKIQLRVLVLLCAAFCAPLMWGVSDDEQRQLNRRLHDASRGGNTDQVVQLLGQNAQVNSGNWCGETPLHTACYRGHKEVVELLLANKAAINQATKKSGETPLYTACCQGYTKVVELLLANGAAVDQANDFGRNPLYRACCLGHTEVVELLLANKAAINQANKDGWTPLYAACTWGHIKTVKMLLANGAAVDQANKNGGTPLYVACTWGHTKTVKMLLANQAVVDQEDKDGKTPLRMVCEEYSEEQRDKRKAIIELLIVEGADMDKVLKKFANTAAGDLVAKLVQASPKGKRKRAKQSGFVDNAHGE